MVSVCDDPLVLQTLLASWGRLQLPWLPKALTPWPALHLPLLPMRLKNLVWALWPSSDPTDWSSPATPAAACVRRLQARCRQIVSQPSSAPQPADTAAAAPVSKLSPDRIHDLRKQFLSAYPTMPSADFLSLLRASIDSKVSLWVPWRHRTSAQDVISFNEARRPRTDTQLLRSVLQGEPDPASALASTSGPTDVTVRRHLAILATAIALLQDVHLLVMKRFNDKFLSLPLSRPIDPSLRAPNLQEILAADRTVWAAVTTMLRDCARISAYEGMTSAKWLCLGCGVLHACNFSRPWQVIGHE